MPIFKEDTPTIEHIIEYLKQLYRYAKKSEKTFQKGDVIEGVRFAQGQQNAVKSVMSWLNETKKG